MFEMIITIVFVIVPAFLFYCFGAAVLAAYFKKKKAIKKLMQQMQGVDSSK